MTGPPADTDSGGVDVPRAFEPLPLFVTITAPVTGAPFKMPRFWP